MLVLVRGRPSLNADAGVFVSIAGSLAHGHPLYTYILDNKDPLFYYTEAAAFSIVGWTGPFLLDAVWLAIAAASTVLLLRAIDAPKLTAAIGFFTYPLLLTGHWYYAGYSLLAALSFAPLIAWLWVRGSFTLAGAVLGIALLFKVNLAVVLASGPIALLLLGHNSTSVRAAVAKAAAGVAAIAAVAAAGLALGGELGGYLENVMNNFAYSHEVLTATGREGGIVGHIKVAAGATGKQPLHLVAFVGVFLLAALLATRTLARPGARRANEDQRSAVRTLGALFLCSALATGATLALTAAWSPHDEMLAYPALMLIVFATALVGSSAVSVRRTVAVCAVAGGGVALLSGVSVSRSADGAPISTWFGAAHSETASLLERAAATRFAGTREISFAHLGQNDERGVAAFLDERFLLACPEIAQYVFTRDLPSTLRCLGSKRPLLILVTPSFARVSYAPVAWNQFVASASRYLYADYERELAVASKSEGGLIEVWALRGAR